MKVYELTYIVSPESTFEEAEAASKEIESFIQSKEGIVLKQSNPSARTLSYPIKQHASGFAGSVEFNLEPENLREIEQKLAKTGRIVRHMIIIKKPTKERKQRRQRPAFTVSTSAVEAAKVQDDKTASVSSQEEQKPGSEKVELKDIEQKLEELLGE